MSEIKVPEGWENISLNEACYIIMGQSPDGHAINQINKGYPFLQGNAEFGTKYPTEKNWTTNPTRIAEKNSILLSVRAPVGELNIANKEYCIGRGLASLNYKKCTLEFLYFAITHNKYQFLNLSQGSTFEAINRNNIEEFIILIPKSKQEQQKIAEILSEVDSAIEKTKQLIEKNKRLKTALMQDLLSYGIDENGQIRNPKTHQFKPSPLGDIPVEWEYKTMKQICYIVMGQSPDGNTINQFNNGIPFLQGNAEFRDKYPIEKNWTTQSTRIAKNNSILLSVRAPVGELNIADKDYCIGRGLSSLNSITHSLYYLYFYIGYNKTQFSILSQGSTFEAISRKDIENFNILIPKSKTEQQKIANILSSQDEKIEKLQNKLTKLNHLKTSLMQDLLSGKVRVNKLLESKQ